MKNLLYSIIGGVVALVFFVLGIIFGEFVNILQEEPQPKYLTTNTINTTNEANNLEIKEQINFTIYAKPDIYISNPSFYANNLSDNDKNTINAIFTEILNLVKNNGLCSGGSYQTYLEPRIANNETSRLALNSYLSCKFKADELNSYNQLITDIENVIQNSPVKLHLNKIEPSFSQEANNNHKTELKNGLIQIAKTTQDVLSQKFNKICTLKEISFYGHNVIYTNANARNIVVHSDAAGITAPKQKEQSLSSQADAIYNCK